MRIRTLFLAIPIGLLPALATAQAPTTPQPAGPQASAPAAAEPETDEDALPTTYGTFDFGVRTSSIDGDGARYERYRDLGDGLFLEKARYSTDKRGWMVDLGADHLGRRDQRFAVSAVRPGRLKVWGQWDQIPMLMSRTTRTLFAEPSPGVLTIDNAIRAQVQASASYLATAVQSARQFELSSRRHIVEGGAQFIGHGGLTLTTNVRHTDREGGIPFGGSFGHGQVVETIAPVQHTLTDFDSNAEYMQGNLLVRGGYTGSWFKNELTSLTFDNPWRVSDSTSGGSRGRSSLPPSNSFIGVNGLVSYKLPYKSRVNLSGSIGSLRDSGDPLLPFTVNSALTSPALDRATTEGHAKTSSMNLNFTSRPTQSIDIDLRYRTYDYDNRTPEFLTLQRVGYDNAVSNVTNLALQHSEPFGVKRQTLDADVRLSPIRSLSGGVGFSHLAEERTHRIFEETTDNVFRLSVDLFAKQSSGGVYGFMRSFTVRSKYEHAERRGEGDAAVIGAELEAIGEQPGMRHFDIAARDRDRVTITLASAPISMMTVSGSVAAGKDDYLESLFGLRDNRHRVYSAGFDLAPSEYYGAGLSYSFERYTSLSRSRQANPGVQFTDASRNWATDTADRAHSVIAHAEMLDLAQKFDVTLFADYNRSNGLYRYTTGAVQDRTLPEEAIVPSTLPTPTQLPAVRSELSRANLDVVYKLSERWGIGVSLWFEEYRVKDFGLDSDALSRLDPAGALLLGYQYLPYTATTVWGRAVYRF
jgi:MtrB/PioB family decaheme-associated outer membrane protein